ncbi:MAG: ATP-binding protein [Gammaproteobacteria bacterium]|nr:ATP-binding protein [Gammaproteobacteria bacterium]
MNGSGVLDKKLNQHLKELHLPTIRNYYPTLCELAMKDSMSYEDFLLELFEKECETRQSNRIQRFLRESKLPLEKTMEMFELKRLPLKVTHQVKALVEGCFVPRHENVLVFGNPGSGKTHLMCAIAQELVRKGQRVLFSTCGLLVQDLLLAKKELSLSKKLKKLSKYDVLIIDDIGYVQHDREEMEVLFTLFAERYERGSVMLTSNLPFSKWEQIFKDPMVTAAAIDRLVHHSVIIELNLESYRMAQALHSQKEKVKK